MHSAIYLTLCHTVFILPQHGAYNTAHIYFSQVKTNILQQFNNRYSIMHFTISALESPFSEEQCLDQPVLCNEAGWKLPAPLVSCSSAVPRDIHLVSLVWLVNLVGGGDTASADHICPESCFQRNEWSSQPGRPFKSHHTTFKRMSYTSISILL